MYTSGVSQLRFEWDPRKATSNKAKHGVSFEEASSVFADELALFVADPEHSDEEEERFILLGLSSHVRLLVVVHAHREDDGVVRIISARRANTRERTQYRESNSP